MSKPRLLSCVLDIEHQCDIFLSYLKRPRPIHNIQSARYLESQRRAEVVCSGVWSILRFEWHTLLLTYSRLHSVRVHACIFLR